MRFHALLLRNLMQRPVRTVLTAAGIAIGIAAVVSLTSIARGFANTWVRVYSARGTDIVVTRGGSLSPVPPAFLREEAAPLAAMPGVAATSAMLSDVASVEASPIVLLFGWEPGTFVWEHLRLVSGRWPGAGEHAVVVGRIAQEVLRKSPGDTIRLEPEAFTVTGVFDSPSLAENGAIVMALPELQRLKGQPGRVNFVNVRLAPSLSAADAERLRAGIPARLPGFRAFTATEVAEHNAAIQAVRAMSLAVTIVAAVVAIVGVMNTMLMSVFERVGEIGLLLAVGWRRSRVIAMLVGESALIGLAGGIAGTIVAVLSVRVLEQASWMRGKVEADYTAPVLGAGILLAVGFAVAGGAYPAWRASRMNPADAIRHE